MIKWWQGGDAFACERSYNHSSDPLILMAINALPGVWDFEVELKMHHYASLCLPELFVSLDMLCFIRFSQC